MFELNGINLNDLGMLAKRYPRYAELFGQLYGIDKLIKNFATDTITTYAIDPSAYFVKTELLNSCYNFYLYNSERNATIGRSWLFDDFLTKCQTKMIEKDLEEVIKKMINKFENTKSLKLNKINWIN